MLVCLQVIVCNRPDVFVYLNPGDVCYWTDLCSVTTVETEVIQWLNVSRHQQPKRIKD